MVQQNAAEAWLERIKSRLSSLPNGPAAFEGATDEEIAQLEEYAGGKFPASYRQFLEHMGRKAGALFRGSEALLTEEHHLRLRNSAECILRRTRSDWRLPNTAFVFLMHQGYQFMFIDVDGGDDPAVYLVTDREPHPKELSNCFTAYIESYVADLAELARTRPWVFDPLPGSEQQDE